eukprot:CAMPEP_0170510584 /NCGR_PEP_ID=MMETSP0208-20121228/65847_1 /TAXON_ID=197538 /ORGANISM="Strombidium inclinatum, Strain S3" /LENGTH=147 /DNA_ID=CAMNT_0010794063 /DNA_START=1436 /DNA_END=1879 /DNA_ORIENTATION=+
MLLAVELVYFKAEEDLLLLVDVNFNILPQSSQDLAEEPQLDVAFGDSTSVSLPLGEFSEVLQAQEALLENLTITEFDTGLLLGHVELPLKADSLPLDDHVDLGSEVYFVLDLINPIVIHPLLLIPQHPQAQEFPDCLVVGQGLCLDL